MTCVLPAVSPSEMLQGLSILTKSRNVDRDVTANLAHKVNGRTAFNLILVTARFTWLIGGRKSLY